MTSTQQPSDGNPTAENLNGGSSPQLPPAPEQSIEQPAFPAQQEEDVIRDLAALTPTDYDRRRKDAAKSLGVQLKTLDQRVKAARRTDEDTSASGRLLFPPIEPWSEPVVPADLLNAIVETIERFVVLAPEEAVASALWVAHTYLVDVFEHSPLLIVNAPERACAKTLLQDVLARMSYRPLPAANTSVPALFRCVEKWQPTLFLDEADTFFRDNHDLHGMINAGYQRGGGFLRCEPVGDSFEPRQYSVYCAKSIAGIALEKHLPIATMSRGVVVNLRRKLKDESVQRLRHADHGVFEVLASKLVRFAADHEVQLAKAHPALPDALSDRDQDNWASLLAIAECAGPEWLTRATAAALRLCKDGDSTETIGSQLLADIDAAFDKQRTDKLSSVDLIKELVSDPEGPWGTWNRGKPLTPRQLAKLLAPYGIKSKTVRISAHNTPKGYDLAQFEDATARYRGTTPGLPPRRNICPEPMTGKESDVADTASESRHAPPHPPQRNVAATPKSLPDMESGGVAAGIEGSADPETEGVGDEPSQRDAAETADDFWGIGFGVAAADDSEDGLIAF